MKVLAPGIFKANEDLEFTFTTASECKPEKLSLKKDYLLILVEPSDNGEGEVRWNSPVDSLVDTKSFGVFKVKSICDALDPLLQKDKLVVVKYNDPNLEADMQECSVRDWVERPDTLSKIQVRANRALALLKQTIKETVELARMFDYESRPLYFNGYVGGTELRHILIVEKEPGYDKDKYAVTIKIILTGPTEEFNREHEASPEVEISSKNAIDLEIAPEEWQSSPTSIKIDNAIRMQKIIENCTDACKKISDALPLVRDYKIKQRLLRCAAAESAVKFFS